MVGSGEIWCNEVGSGGIRCSCLPIVGHGQAGHGHVVTLGAKLEEEGEVGKEGSDEG